MEVATGVDPTATAELMILADVVELVVGVAALVREEEVVAIGVIIVGIVVVGLGLVRVVTSVAIPKENTLDEVLQHWSSPCP